MGRKPLGWSAVVLGLAGVVLFAGLIAGTLLFRGVVHDWAVEYLDPADQAIERMADRLDRTRDHADLAEAAVAGLAATGADQVVEAAREKIAGLQMDLLALEASVFSVDAGMEIVSALPFLEEQRRAFQGAVAKEIAALRERLTGVDARLLDAQALAAEIRAGGDAAELARIAVRALAEELAPTIAAVEAFLNELGLALREVRANLQAAAIRVGHVLTVATLALCFIFAWLAFAHYCVYLAGRRLLEEDARLQGREAVKQ
jgi:hypothetical protein